MKLSERIPEFFRRVVAATVAVAAAANLLCTPVLAGELGSTAADRAAAFEQELIKIRRHYHQYPELSNREFKTAESIAAHLKRLGLEVHTGIAHTGVVGVLKGGRAGPTIALRADIDGLPVTERSDLPFASRETTEYNGQKTGVMHACGHDTHVAVQLAAAEVLSGIRDELPGTVVFIFQPAEEGAPEGEEGGAELMISEGVLEKFKPEAIFGFHTWAPLNAGVIGFRSGPMMASYDNFKITIRGRQTHASRPWGGVDPIVVSAQVVLAIQTIASRQVNVTLAPSVVSIGSIHGGIRNNIIPDEVEMLGTVRAFDADMRLDILDRLKKTVMATAEAGGATAEVEFDYGYPVTINDPDLTARVTPLLRETLGEENVLKIDLITGAEDFSYFQNEIPGFYFFLGATPRGEDASKAPSNHSPLFYVDESTLLTGLQALLALTINYLETGG